MHYRSITRFGAVVLAIAACGSEPPPPPPPPEVVVMPVAVRDVPLVAEFTGEIRGAEDVEILARVTGFLQQVAYQEGSFVRQGDLLFVIDPRPFEAAVARARAAVTEADAVHNRAVIQVNRLRPLAEQNAVSQQDLDNAIASEQATRASAEAARAQLVQAELDLSYTQVTSPINGLAGNRLVDVGAFVGSPQPTRLTVVSDINPIRFDFGVAESRYLELVRDIQASGDDRSSLRTTPSLELVLADGTVHPQKGVISFVGRGVDPGTGTLPVQARFANPDNILRPGQFARIRVPLSVAAGAVVIPQRAVQELQGQFSVFVVHPDSTVESRPVTTSARVGTEFVIRSGLQAGEVIVVEGLQRIRHGAKVRPGAAAPADTARGG